MTTEQGTKDSGTGCGGLLCVDRLRLISCRSLYLPRRPRRRRWRRRDGGPKAPTWSCSAFVMFPTSPPIHLNALSRHSTVSSLITVNLQITCKYKLAGPFRRQNSSGRSVPGCLLWNHSFSQKFVNEQFIENDRINK